MISSSYCIFWLNFAIWKPKIDEIFLEFRQSFRKCRNLSRIWWNSRNMNYFSGKLQKTIEYNEIIQFSISFPPSRPFQRAHLARCVGESESTRLRDSSNKRRPVVGGGPTSKESIFFLANEGEIHKDVCKMSRKFKQYGMLGNSLAFCEIPGKVGENSGEKWPKWVKICKFRRKSTEILKNGAKVGNISWM